MGLDIHGNAGTRANAARLAFARAAPDPVDPILQLADSLALDAQQRASLSAVSVAYVAHRDSAAAPGVAVVVGEGAKLTDAMMLEQFNRYGAVVQPWRIDARDRAVALLTPAQRVELTALLGAKPLLTSPSIRK
ncbi:MAG TPA: hypothetical protein VHW65_05900 [Gemmatimonadales bacterium]|jgi:hypothetical protein|nr:hypothetical protein [Gemmatimonadales bacterium]